jgi:hypothetical protein
MMFILQLTASHIALQVTKNRLIQFYGGHFEDQLSRQTEFFVAKYSHFKGTLLIDLQYSVAK